MTALTDRESAILRAALHEREYPQSLMQARRACILAAYRHLTAEQRANVCEELAELGDPDTVDEPAGDISDEMDLRNSRPFPY
jgi:hypothetical protein